MTDPNRLWLLNLKPDCDARAKGCTGQCLSLVLESAGPIETVLQDALQRYPGRVLDVVGPQGESYLLCCTPPWYQPAE